MTFDVPQLGANHITAANHPWHLRQSSESEFSPGRNGPAWASRTRSTVGLRVCQDRPLGQNASCVQISTDYVFNGERACYLEDERRVPSLTTLNRPARS